MKKFFIRRLDESTIASATRLVCLHVYEESGSPIEWEDARKFIEEADHSGAVFVACCAKHVRGIVVGLRNGMEGHYEVRNLYVEEGFRGGSAAKQLLQALIDWCPDENANIFIATTSLPRAFYRTLGFELSHFVSRAELKVIRKLIGGQNGECSSSDPGSYCGGRGPGPDERGETGEEAVEQV